MFRNTNNRNGTVAVEFALVLPILFLFLYGSYELCRANVVMHTCESAAYEAARTGIIPGTDANKISTAAQSILETIGIQNAQVSTTPAVIDDNTESVTVTIQVNYAENSVLVPNFITSDIVRSCTMNREKL